MEIFLKTQPKPVLVSNMLFKCRALAAENAIPGYNRPDASMLIENHLNSMDEDEFQKLYKEEDHQILIDILKKKIFIDDYYKHSPKREVIEQLIEKCIIISHELSTNQFDEHFGNVLIAKFANKFRKITKANLIQLLKNECELKKISEKVLVKLVKKVYVNKHLDV